MQPISPSPSWGLFSTAASPAITCTVRHLPKQADTLIGRYPTAAQEPAKEQLPRWAAKLKARQVNSPNPQPACVISRPLTQGRRPGGKKKLRFVLPHKDEILELTSSAMKEHANQRCRQKSTLCQKDRARTLYCRVYYPSISPSPSRGVSTSDRGDENKPSLLRPL